VVDDHAPSLLFLFEYKGHAMSILDSGEKPTILVVDDTPDNLTLVSNLLKKDYRVRVAINGEKALKIAFSETPPDLILLDVMMPVMDGYEVCQQLRNSHLTAHIPIIFLTAKSEVEDERKGLSLGASDYITKPISPPILEARFKTHLAAKAYADFLTDKTAYLESEVSRRTREVSAIQDVTM
jgi:putative two-component system response regulator